MDEFPEYLNVRAKSHFSTRVRLNLIKLLRQDLHDLVVKGNENDYFAIDNFCDRHDTTLEIVYSLLKVLKVELEKLGWKTKTSFGGTGLFIYSTADPPPNCYPDEF